MLPDMPQNEPRVPRAEFRNIHGILLLDKPLGLSSNKALQVAKRLFRARKAGHTGSLDPLATGLLPLCFGEATKIAGLLLGSRKAYLAEACLGVVTASGDAEGEVLERNAVPVLDEAVVDAAMQAFRGRITQIPPVYSALKQGGVPLYKRVRRGEHVEAPPRQVDIHAFDLLELHGEYLRVSVECGSGTYIRSLLADLGRVLGCGAHLTALRRTWVEPFRIPQMHDLEALRVLHDDGDQAALDACLLPIDAGLQGLPAIHLDAVQSLLATQGRPIANPAPSGLSRLYAADGRLLALAESDGQGLLRVQRGFNLPPIRERLEAGPLLSDPKPS